MDRLCEDYCGGIWNLYTLNNGGAFMAPEPDDDDDETWVLFNAMNGIGVVTKADLASMEQISLVKSWLREAGAHNVLVTSAVNNNGVTELLPCCIQKKAVVNFDWFSDENDDGDTQIRINEQ